MANKIQIRRDTASNWTSSNPTLSQGEQGYETDTGKLKIGDGSTAWTSLGYSFESISIGGNTGVDFNDNVKARFGTGNDLEIYHSGSASIIDDTGNGPLHIKGSTSVDFFASNGEYMAYMVENGAVGLYHDGTQRLNTTSSGIQTNGTINVNNAYTLPTSDGTNGQVLTTDGSGAVTFATASGGADLYAANPSSATNPTATGSNSVAIGSDAQATATNGSIAFGTSTRASGNANAAIGFQANASGVGALAIGYVANAAADFSTAVGRNAKTVTGSSATAIGQAYASGSDSFAAAIATNSSSYGASGTNSIAGGDYNKATATDSLCWGGDSNVAQSGAKSAVVGGWQNNCSGAYSFISGGRGNKITSGSYSRAGGLQADVNGTGIDTWSSGRFSSDGDAQTSKRVLIANTTDATATVLGTQNINSLAANQVTLPNNSAYFFTGTCIARQQAADGTDVGAWEFKGAIRREANAGTTTLIKSTIDEFNVPTGWAIALSADTTNGCLKVQVTGAASTDIRWVATVHTSEVTYA